MSVNIFLDGHSWQNFQDLENKVLECLDYVALDTVHEEVWSNRFGELLIRIGSAIDSFFNKARECYYFDKEQGIKDLRQQNQPDILDYCKFFERYYQLSEAFVAIHQPNGIFYKAYSPFSEFKQNQSPSWWKSYNKVKHEWYDSSREHGNLKNVIESLGGLFILNVLHKDSQKFLVLNNVIKAGDKSYYEYSGVTKNHLLSLLKDSKIGIITDLTLIPFVGDCWANSRLFEHDLRKTSTI